MLAVVMFSCPIVGVTEDKSVLHRVDLAGIPVKTWGTAEHMTGRCGALVKGLSIGEMPVQWKDLRTRGTHYKRCPECRQPKAPL